METINLTVRIGDMSPKEVISIEATVGDQISDYLDTDIIRKQLGGCEVRWFIQGEHTVPDAEKHEVSTKNAQIYGELVPHSYHNFLFPFLWNDDGRVNSRKKFALCLNPHWVPETTADFANGKTEQESKEEPAKKKAKKRLIEEKYKQYHYFNPAARNAIYSQGLSDNEVVWNYHYDISKEYANPENTKPEEAKKKAADWLNATKAQNNQAEYVIKKGGQEFKLKINGIRLKLFATGIGILIFELENYSYPKYSDIVKINDWGRQIYAPFISNGACHLCPDEIFLQFAGIKKDGSLIEKGFSYNSTKLSQPIETLLSNGKYKVSANPPAEGDQTTFHIEPIIDNRMYVACYYLNKPLINSMTEWKNGDYAYMDAAKSTPLGKPLGDAKNANPENYNPASQLYELVYVDGSGLTCKSRKMLAQMLGEDHIYDRWIECGTLTGISEYSFITITNSPADYLAESFLIEYVEMIVIVLAQRASLLNFERMISNSACGNKDICDIQSRYLSFQSQLLLKEVTPQQQGIELYTMMLKNMFIFEYAKQIENQIDDLFAQKTAQNESHENGILLTLAVLGIFSTLDVLKNWICGGWLENLWWITGGAIISALIYLFLKIINKKH